MATVWLRLLVRLVFPMAWGCTCSAASMTLTLERAYTLR
jgi:hypothetical protein